MIRTQTDTLRRSCIPAYDPFGNAYFGVGEKVGNAFKDGATLKYIDKATGKGLTHEEVIKRLEKSKFL